MTITQLIKNAAGNGVISLEKALAVLAPYDKEREVTASLLKEIEPQVGMMLGEKINAHLADMTGTYFNERDYHFERLPGEQ